MDGACPRKYPPHRQNGSIISLDKARASFSEAINAFVGRGRTFSSAAKLADKTGIPVGTLNNYLEGTATPGLHYLLSIMDQMPSEFADMVLSPAMLGAVKRMNADGDCPLMVNSKAAELVAQIGIFMEDGHVDHREKRQMIPVVQALAARCNAFLDGAKDEAA